MWNSIHFGVWRREKTSRVEATHRPIPARRDIRISPAGNRRRGCTGYMPFWCPKKHIYFDSIFNCCVLNFKYEMMGNVSACILTSFPVCLLCCCVFDRPGDPNLLDNPFSLWAAIEIVRPIPKWAPICWLRRKHNISLQQQWLINKVLYLPFQLLIQSDCCREFEF